MTPAIISPAISTRPHTSYLDSSCKRRLFPWTCSPHFWPRAPHFDFWYGATRYPKSASGKSWLTPHLPLESGSSTRIGGCLVAQEPRSRPDIEEPDTRSQLI